ncbi:hypothetical protein D3C87_1158000 [compost metagenome]
MILEGLILVGIFYIFASSGSSTVSKPDEREENERLRNIKGMLEILSGNSNFELIGYNGNPKTVDKKYIYLNVSIKYDMDTISKAAIHELAHVLCPEVGHTTLFYAIEKNLLSSAIRLGYVNGYEMLDNVYPCDAI